MMDELITTKQVQDLLQVDRITVYRMLKDGRLSGVKVGSQWRVRRTELSDLLLGERSLEVSPDQQLHPNEILPVHCLQVIQDVFAEMSNVGSLTTDPDGQPLTEISNSCEFCDLILQSPSGRQACIASWKRLAQTPKSDPDFTQCHAGLQYARGRIEFEDRLTGVQIAGQFYFSEPDKREERARIQTLAETHMLDPQRLHSAAQDIRILGREKQSQISKWLQKVANTFEIIAMERADLVGRLENIAAISSLGN